jgi:hypothetical protein
LARIGLPVAESEPSIAQLLLPCSSGFAPATT